MNQSWDLEILWLRTLPIGGLARAKTQAQYTNPEILLCRKQCTSCAYRTTWRNSVRLTLVWTVLNMTIERPQKASGTCQMLDNMSEFNWLQWLWMCITHLIVFNIIFLWGIFFLFCLLAELIPFLSQHVGGAASNQLTNTDHRQAGGKWLPTLSAPLSLEQRSTSAESELITRQSCNGTTGRSANIDKVLIRHSPW